MQWHFQGLINYGYLYMDILYIFQFFFLHYFNDIQYIIEINFANIITHKYYKIITTYLQCDGYFTSVCEMWGQEPGFKSRGENFTHICLDQAKVEFLSSINIYIYIYIKITNNEHAYCASALRILVKNPVKKSFYEKKKKN